MNLLNKIFSWILKNYIKVILLILIIGLAYGIYLYFYFMAQKKDQEAGDLFLNFYNSYSISDFNEQDYTIVLDQISEIDNDNKRALYEVIILGPEKKYFKFRWQVEKFLENGPLKNCWLTTVVSQPIPMGSST